MKYGVKSKLYKRYLKEYNTYEGARVFCLKQRQIWTNATMQIYEVDGLQSDKLLEEFPPVKPTNYTKIRKKDIRGNYKLKIDLKKCAPKEEFWGESEAEAGMRLQKEADKMSLYGMPIKLTTELSLWEKFLWMLTPTQTIKTEDGTIKLKQRGGKVLITEVTC